MASTYSPNLRLELIGTGEQQGSWGTTTNTNLGTLLEEAIGGYVSVAVTDGADTTLTTSNGGADQSRNMVINLTGALTGARTVICPAIEKVYIVSNATTGGFAVTFKVSGQTGVSIPNGATYVLYVDGTDVRQATGSIASGGTGASTAAGAATNLGLGTGDSPQFAAVNIGNATDTTITRSAAGVIAVEGGVIPKENRVNTFTADQTISRSDTFPVFTVRGDGFPAVEQLVSYTNTGSLRFQRAQGSLASPTIVGSGSGLGDIRFQGYDGAAFQSAAQISAAVDAASAAGDMPGRLVFSTTPDGSTTLTERMRIDSSGNVGIGTNNPGSQLHISASTDTGYRVTKTSQSDWLWQVLDSGVLRAYSYTASAERLRIDGSGNVGIGGNVLVTGAGTIGYGTGSGGTVTQATSKSTGVTLNKTNGKVTMNNAALNATTTVVFVLTNSTCTGDDTVIVNIAGGTTDASKYNVWALPNAGSINVYVRNISAGSLSEAVVLNFAVINGATS